MVYTHYWTPVKAESFPDVAEAVRKIVAASAVPVAGWDGTGEPGITDTEIRLNGVAPGDLETFLLVYNGEREFCKTNHAPYDEVVIAILIAADCCGALEGLASDGYFDEWQGGIDLFTRAVRALEPRELARLGRQLTHRQAATS